MRKVYLSVKLALLAILLTASGKISAQTFSTWGLSPTGYVYDTCVTYGDTMRFTFTGIPAGVYGMVKMVVYYEGDHGASGIEESDNYLAATPAGTNLANLGFNGPHPSASDCMPEDSTILYFNSSLIVPLGSTFYIKNIPRSGVDFFCTVERCKIRLEMQYCPFGIPTYANFSGMTDLTACPGETLSLTGTPAGGTFTGPGVSGSIFDPGSMPAGNYTITYTATDGIGCTTSADTTVIIGAYPVIADATICLGDTAALEPGGGIDFTLFADAALSIPVDTGSVLMPSPAATTTYYVMTNDNDYRFQIDALLTSNAAVVDHALQTGDDRSGIAISEDWVYITGDANTLKIDHTLNISTATSLPTKDGIFSNLGNGAIYTLGNSSTGAMGTFPGGTYIFDMIYELDDNLVPTGNTIALSDPIAVAYGAYQSGIFSGYDLLIIFSGSTNEWYAIDLSTGQVDLLGSIANPQFSYSENWTIWGIAEFDGTNYSVLFNGSPIGPDIYRRVLPSGTATVAAAFPSGLSDMACFTYSKWDNRWYFHHEYNSGTFGGSGSGETAGYADAAATTSVLTSGFSGCPSDVVVNIPTVNIGTDVYFCQGDEAEFSVGLGYDAISWNGNNSDLNTYATTASETVIIEAHEIASGCTLHDTANAIMNPLPTVTFALTDDHACTSQTAFALTGGAPAGGVYSGSFVSGTNFNASSAGNGTHIVTYTYIDANGCLNFAQDAIFVDACVGVNELGSELLSIYPNPANAMIMINAGSYVSQPVNIDIYDAQGKVVYTEKTTLVNNHEINVSSLENGVYQVILSVEGNRSVAKLVIQK